MLKCFSCRLFSGKILELKGVVDILMNTGTFFSLFLFCYIGSVTDEMYTSYFTESSVILFKTIFSRQVYLR